jgi:hypothetical protein
MKELFAVIVFSWLTSFAYADNRSDQMNPNNDAYWDSRGYDGRPDDWGSSYPSSTPSYSRYDYNNRSNQLNPNNDAYWQSRGYNERPNDWSQDSTSDANSDNSVHYNSNNSQANSSSEKTTNDDAIQRNKLLSKNINNKNIDVKKTHDFKDNKIFKVFNLVVCFLAIR